MSEDLELIKSSENIFRDIGCPDADVLHIKSLLASKIIAILEENNLSIKEAAKLTGIDPKEPGRICQPKLKKFSIDRFITILNKFDAQVKISFTVEPASTEK